MKSLKYYENKAKEFACKKYGFRIKKGKLDMEIELIATGLGHRKASYEMFDAIHNANISEAEWLILAKLSEINDRLKLVEDWVVLTKKSNP